MFQIEIKFIVLLVYYDTYRDTILSHSETLSQLSTPSEITSELNIVTIVRVLIPIRLGYSNF